MKTKIKNSDLVNVKMDKTHIIIKVRFPMLIHATENNDTLMNHNEDGWECPKVINKNKFMNAIFQALITEEEEGTTIVHTMLDQAISLAIDDGCDGIEYKETEF